ncbi:hypothetical protein AGMMS49940_12890 [Spirochaetia bacterium]|nr:hypothetical protein AGMMS49940_12890 [Spirochaetia bacterium]
MPHIYNNVVAEERKIVKKVIINCAGKRIFLAFLTVVLVTGIVPAQEQTIGTVQTSFVARTWDSWFNKDAIKTQAYIRLMEAARQKYPGTVDVHEIVWTRGKSVDELNREIIATGKIIQVPAEEADIGMVQTSFIAQSWDSWFNKEAVKTHAYIKLLEAAGQRYSGSIEIKDIVWVIVKSEGRQNTEIIAAGKVVQVK